MAAPLVERFTGDVIPASDHNDVKSYIEDATYGINTNSLTVGSTEVITSARVLQNVTGNVSMFTNDSGYALSSNVLHLDQTTPQEIINGIPTLDETRNIIFPHQLVDKLYVDNAVTSLGQRFYMLSTASGVSTYYNTSITPSEQPESNVTATDPIDDGFIAGWISPDGATPIKLITGVYDWDIFAETTGGNKIFRLYWTVVERKSDDSEVLIATSAESNILNGKVRLRVPLILNSDYELSAGSRIVGKIYASLVSGAAATNIILYSEGVSDSHWEIPVNTEVLDTMYLKNITNESIGSLSDVDTTGVAATKILKYNGTTWVVADDNNTTYTAGTGLTLTGTQFTSNDSQINHNALSNYDVAQHRTINDVGTDTTDLWSASKISTELDAYALLPQGIEVSGATDPLAVNGDYLEDGTQNGEPAYTNGAYWLWYDGGGWVISLNKGDTYDNYIFFRNYLENSTDGIYGIVLPFDNTLLWQRAVSGSTRNHASTLTYASGLTLGGHTWVVPEGGEIGGTSFNTPTEGGLLYWSNVERGLAQGNAAGKNIGSWLNDNWGFTGFVDNYYWSNTYSNSPTNTQAWIVILETGYVINFGVTSYYRVVCVSRNASGWEVETSGSYFNGTGTGTLTVGEIPVPLDKNTYTWTTTMIEEHTDDADIHREINDAGTTVTDLWSGSKINTELGNKLENISEDTTPELGGELDAGAHSIGFTEGSAIGTGATTIDWKLGNKFKFTFGAQNETFTFTNPSNPCNLLLVMVQDSVGSRTATFPAAPSPSAVKWAGGIAPTLSTAGNSIDIISFYFDGTNYYGVPSLDFQVNIGNIGLFGGGFTGSGSNVIDYVIIDTTGNATDFGDLTEARNYVAGCSSSTRGLFGGGGSYSNVIDYVTISSAGNATDFGDLTVARYGAAGCSSSTRGLFGGGNDGSGSNVIDYVTIATTGNATDFGDLTVARYGVAGCSSSTRGLFAGGYDGAYSNVIDYVTIATTGNATDFGDLTVGRNYLAGLSNAHGGL